MTNKEHDKEHYKRQSPHVNKGTSWNNVSDWYEKHVGKSGSDYHQNVIIPKAIKLLSPKKDDKILDIACGQGVFSRKLASFGSEVVGIDASDKLIDYADSHSGDARNLSYEVADARDLSMFANSSFDAATCIMALQNMDPIAPIIKEMARVLKPNGKFLFVMSHPCFRIPRQSGWGFDEKRKIQYRRVDSYLSEKRISIQMHPGENSSIKTWTFHKPLTSYFNEFYTNNLAAIKIEEWITHRRTNEAHDNKSREEIPLFMALLGIKLGGSK